MAIRYLINADGRPFDTEELKVLRQSLERLDDTKRAEYRNANAAAIAQLIGSNDLIVSGPGTGKSHLFLERIDAWYTNDNDAEVIVTTFVRKLVADLQGDIQQDTKLSTEQKKKITVSTLHRLARSVLEENGGTQEWPFERYIRIIGQSWKTVVWADALALSSVQEDAEYTWSAFEEQLHTAIPKTTGEWKTIHYSYNTLCKFYNAAGFADLITRARDALQENATLIEPSYYIVDEYQDFNEAENQFISRLTQNAKELLIVGDDEQVLYEKLKSGNAALIRGRYKDEKIVNAMLPFCGRCSYHITKAADAFISQSADANRIEKLYLPIKSRDDKPKVQVVACATPSAAIDYLSKFVKDHKLEIEARMKELAEGTKKDAFLLILSPSRGATFLGKDNVGELEKLIAPFRGEGHGFDSDYYRLLAYYSVAKNPNGNFAFRKVMFYENLSPERSVELIEKALANGVHLCDLDDEEIVDINKKCLQVKAILDELSDISKSLNLLSKILGELNKEALLLDLENRPIKEHEIATLEEEADDAAEVSELQAGSMSAVEFLTIVGSKGLSADNVIILGFDNVNMSYTTQNAFYVAVTRAREGLHLLTALQARGASAAHGFLERLPDDNTDFKSYKKTGGVLSDLGSKQGFKDYLGKLVYARNRR